VLAGLQQVHGVEDVQQQLLTHTPHARATVCRAVCAPGQDGGTVAAQARVY
jgi:hypothetical protein